MRIRRVMAVCGRFAGRRPVAPRSDDESVIWMDPYGRIKHVKSVTRGSTKRRDYAFFLTWARTNRGLQRNNRSGPACPPRLGLGV